MANYDWDKDDIFTNLKDDGTSEVPSDREAAQGLNQAEETIEQAVSQQTASAQEEAAPAEEAYFGHAPVQAAEQIPVQTNEQPRVDGAYSFRRPADPFRPVEEPFRAQTTQRDGSAPTETVRPAQSAAQPQADRKVHQKKSRGLGKGIVALALVCALIGGMVGAGGFYLISRSGNSSSPADGRVSTVQVATPRETSSIQTVHVENGQLLTADQVYEQNVNSTVGITTEIITTNYWGYQSTAAAAGSGFILTEDGYILTNQHVIDSANTITVAMYDGTTYPATLVGYDASNDIAVLKIDAKGLTPVTLGDSDALKVGQDVIAIGNPLGELTFSLTRGAVSALNRSVSLSNATMNLIQTDCAINSGNSGGALFNLYGEVVGITNAKYSTSAYSSEASIDNIGFAIPINSVRDIVTSIIEKGYISKPYIGVSVANVSDESQSYGLPQGAAVRAVEAGSPAEQAGLKENDIITAVNGTTVTTYVELGNIISECKVGDELELTVYRQSQTLTLKVTVGEKTQDALPQAGTQEQSQSSDGQNPWGGSNPFGGSDPFGGSGIFPWGFGG